VNAMTRMEEEEIQVARIRGLQAIYRVEHEALIQWGRWSMDCDIAPKLEPPAMFQQYRAGEEWGELPPPEPAPVGYDAKLAEMLDARIHGFGGLPYETRHLLRMAYATHAVPESQFARRCGCGLDSLCERLEGALIFVGKWL